MIWIKYFPFFYFGTESWPPPMEVRRETFTDWNVLGISVDMFYPLLAEQRVLEDKKASAKRMIADGKLSVEEIARYAGLPVNMVEALANLQPA